MPESDAESNQFYRRSMQLLQEAEVPFLLGGAYAFRAYTGIARQTKDFDLFLRAADFDAALDVFRASRYRTEKTFPHWLGKAFGPNDSIDLIHRAGNGLCAVDDLWFDRAPAAEIFGLQTRLTPPEEMIWMKAYIMERERYDGADVAHLLLRRGAEIDWKHLLWRFGSDWQLLLCHLLLFQFIYPAKKDRVPPPVLEELLGRLKNEEMVASAEPLCRGTLLSRAQYLPDVRAWNFRDARLEPRARLTREEIENWSEAAPAQVKSWAVGREN